MTKTHILADAQHSDRVGVPLAEHAPQPADAQSLILKEKDIGNRESNQAQAVVCCFETIIHLFGTSRGNSVEKKGRSQHLSHETLDRYKFSLQFQVTAQAIVLATVHVTVTVQHLLRKGVYSSYYTARQRDRQHVRRMTPVVLPHAPNINRC